MHEPGKNPFHPLRGNRFDGIRHAGAAMAIAAGRLAAGHRNPRVAKAIISIGILSVLVESDTLLPAKRIVAQFLEVLLMLQKEDGRESFPSRTSTVHPFRDADNPNFEDVDEVLEDRHPDHRLTRQAAQRKEINCVEFSLLPICQQSVQALAGAASSQRPLRQSTRTVPKSFSLPWKRKLHIVHAVARCWSPPATPTNNGCSWPRRQPVRGGECGASRAGRFAGVKHPVIHQQQEQDLHSTTAMCVAKAIIPSQAVCPFRASTSVRCQKLGNSLRTLFLQLIEHKEPHASIDDGLVGARQPFLDHAEPQ